MATKAASSRATTITPLNNGDLLEFGPASTMTSVGTFVMQFDPSLDFVGSVTLLGRVLGQAAQNAPMLPLPYRRVNVAGAVSDYAIVADPITSAGIIQVPCNGLSLTLLVSCTVGTCRVFSWDLSGPSVP